LGYKEKILGIHAGKDSTHQVIGIWLLSWKTASSCARGASNCAVGGGPFSETSMEAFSLVTVNFPSVQDRGQRMLEKFGQLFL
jgi:hypothetical protein